MLGSFLFNCEGLVVLSHSLIGLPIAIAASFGVLLGLAIMRRSIATASRAVSNLGLDFVGADALIFRFLRTCSVAISRTEASIFVSSTI